MGRKHLTEIEVGKLLEVAGKGRNAERDQCLLALMFRHGLRVSEACDLRLEQVDIESGVLHVYRLKNGLDTVQPLQTCDKALVLAWLDKRETTPRHDYFFVSERKGRLSRGAIYVLIKKWGEKAGLPVSAHPHMLRHACGYALADQGIETRLIQDYLGHRNIQNTVIYTASNAERFRRLWQ